MKPIDTFLKILGFETKSQSVWQRCFDYPATGEFLITVNTAKRTIDYPPPIALGDRTTCNFDHPENFVVLECVCRLLAKGYDPATLILEKRYQLGRGASGGKSDITVLRRANDTSEQACASPLLIIECKTFGKEHDDEKAKTLEEGGQIFGYLQQDRSATHLCIYSSQVANELASEIEYRCDIIHVEDSPEAIEKFAKKEKADSHTAARQAVPLFKHAHNRETLHHVWKTSYGATFRPSGIFEDDFTPYSIGYIPRRGKDLREFNSQNGSTRVFNEFMEILRHNNVSDKENAFNRLCTIILAKLIDEDRDPEAILDFQWFPNKDTPEDLIDRLQRLYKRGMKETLSEEITYFEERDIDRAFMAHRRDMAKNEVKKIFRALKFYTNSDFAFKEVHNKKLFEQNTQVVREVVELFQDYRLKYSSKQAFLGNLFELLLNSGFKQSEGQFFTPIPVSRFIARCLPLRERIVAAQAAGDRNVIPRVIDYACGSAHFLTEAVEEIHEDLEALGRPEAVNTTWTRDHVWGIEKDYRLARTAKIAMFLHGAGDATILHEDGLDHANPALPALGTVDVLIANPPYSVKDFKQHLNLQSNSFDLLPHLTANSSEIETLFVERTAQLLAPGGVAGIILPSSILSNSGIYRRTRALLLENFLLRGIVELGGSAFIATGTNTVVLFLERRPPTHREHFVIRAEVLFHEERKPNDSDFADSDLLRFYTTAAGLDFDDYRVWLADLAGELPTSLAETTLFTAYLKEFDALAETRKRREQVTFKKLPKDEREAEMRGKFLRHCREAEKTKFLYFALINVAGIADGELVSQRTTILRTAGDKSAEQTFLGYKWSQRRGAEGMVYLREPYDGGSLYSTAEGIREEPAHKAAHHIRRSFIGSEPEEIPEDSPLAENLRVVATAEFLDFKQTSCDLNFNLSPAETVEVPVFDTKFPLVPLDEVVLILGGGTPSTKNPEYWGGDIPWLSVADFRDKVRYVNSADKSITEAGLKNSNTQVLQSGDLIISARGTVGELAQLAIPMAFNQSCYGLRGTEKIDNGFLLYILRMLASQMKSRSSGATFGSITTRHLKSFLLPLPPLVEQRKIVKEIEKIEQEEAQASVAIEAATAAIDSLIADCYQRADIPKRPIAELAAQVQYGLSKAMNEEGNGYKIFRMNEIAAGRMVDGGKMKRIDISAKEFAEYRLKKGDVLFNRTNGSFDKVGKTGLFELEDEYCFASYLIRIVPGKSIKGDILCAFMNSTKFLTTIRKQAVCSAGQYNINASKMKAMEVPTPSLPEQEKILSILTKNEAARTQAESVLIAAPERKRQILLERLK